MSQASRSDQTLAERTFRCDLFRGAAVGIIESGCMAFTLLVAIRYFNASSGLKAAITAAPSIGLLLTPASLFIFSRLGFRPSRVNASLYLFATFALVGMAFAPSLLGVSVCYFACLIVVIQYTPMDMQLYTANYDVSERGKRVSAAAMVSALSGGCFGFIGGRILDADIAWYPGLYGCMAAAALAASVASFLMPSKPLEARHSGNPWQNLSLIWKDRLFGFLLMSWMFLGFGNLMSIPIRIEYLANPRYGIDASNFHVALLTIALPLGFRVAATRVWGVLFDRLPLVPIRNLVSLVFISSIVCFFSTHNLYIIGIGSALFGIALGGGRLMWSLWVTKIAPEGKRSSYQSVHGALTGARGIFAPFVGYALVEWLGPLSVCWVAVGLLVLSMVLFHAVRNHSRIRS